ncbi:MAG: hypothetical protein KF783_15585 [Sphingomonas sp.]|nr:hypothetical protein [Sphingomonas sp.]
MAAVLAGCGGSKAPDGNKRDDAPSPTAKTATATPAAATVTASRAEVEQAWRCRGLISAAFAARTILKAEMPAELADVRLGAVNFWIERAGTLRAPGMTEEELDALTAKSARILMTREAIDKAAPDIRACLDLQKTL